MMQRGIKRALGLGLLAGAAYAAYRWWKQRVPDNATGVEWATAPFPFPPVPRPVLPLWVEPEAEGACPASHPVKGKTGSGIYHVPGGANYQRTHADRCYLDEDAALRDGLRRSKV
jgi:hypothetical protein